MNPFMTIILSPLLVGSLVVTDPHKLIDLFLMEEQIVFNLKMVRGLELFNSEALELYLESAEQRFRQVPLPDFSELGEENTGDYEKRLLEELAGNPLHVFNLMDRLVILLPKILKEFAEHDQTKYIEDQMKLLMEGRRMPDKEDFEAASQDVSRTQFAQNIDPVDFSLDLSKGEL